MISTSVAIAFIRQKIRAEVLPETLHAYFEEVVLQRVDAEREDLAKLALEMEVDSTSHVLMAAARRGTDYLVGATATMLRREFALLCRSRKQSGETVDEPEVTA